MIMLTGIMNAQSFDFDCPWLPLFETQISNFPQSDTYTVRYIEVTKEGGEFTYEWSSELDLGFDVNGDKDYHDNIRRFHISEATYTASHNLGSHVKAATRGGWEISNNFHTAKDAYDDAVDKIPDIPDTTGWARKKYEDTLRNLSPLVTVTYTNYVDYYLNELSTNYHVVTVGEYVWDGEDPVWTLHGIGDGQYYQVWWAVHRELLKIKYGI